MGALRELKLLLRTQHPCTRPQLTALWNCVDYVARHDHIFQDPDADEVMHLAGQYTAFSAGQRTKVDGWVRNGRQALSTPSPQPLLPRLQHCMQAGWWSCSLCSSQTNLHPRRHLLCALHWQRPAGRHSPSTAQTRSAGLFHTMGLMTSSTMRGTASGASAPATGLAEAAFGGRAQGGLCLKCCKQQLHGACGKFSDTGIPPNSNPGGRKQTLEVQNAD